MKIILIANTDWYLFNFRLSLASLLRESGHEVLLVSPPGDYADRLRKSGFRWHGVMLSRRGANPFCEAMAVVRLWKLYKTEKPDLVHHFTIKPVLWGSIAARLACVPQVVNAITGLGYIFTARNAFTMIARPLVRWLYTYCLGGARVIFQNQRDSNYFIQAGLIKTVQAAVIPGSGVDVEHFHPTPLPKGVPLVVLPARMLWDKGVGEFVQAAKIIKEAGLNARFALAGSPDAGNPRAIPPQKLQDWEAAGLIEYWGWREDMAAVYQQASLVCLPSYGEGLAKSLIEAAACGRALVASDIPGCREVVEPDVNGLLVPGGNGPALADAIMRLLPDRSRLIQMGQAGRRMAVEYFSVEKINQATIKEYNKF